MRKFLVVLVVLAGLLVACAGNPAQAQSTDKITPTVEISSPEPTSEPTVLPTSIPTEEPTLVPTATPDLRTMVVLTIDDGWSVSVFDAMLDILSQHDSRATFFLVATASINLGPERLERLVMDGHEIAYHSYNHDDLDILQTWGTREWSEDYDRWVGVMMDLLGPELYAQGIRPYARAPYGLFSTGFIRMSEEKNLTYFGWDTDVHAIHRIPASEGSVVLGHVRQSDLADFEALVSSPIYRVVSLGEYFER